MTSAQRWLLAGLALVVGVFVAVALRARSDDHRRTEATTKLQEFAAQQAQRAIEKECAAAVSNTAVIARGEVGPEMPDRQLAELADSSRRHCIDDSWSSQVTQCLIRANTAVEVHSCLDLATPEQRARLGPNALHLLSAPRVPARLDLPSCDDYRVQIEKLLGCQRIPPAMRATIQQAYDQARAAWASVTDAATRRTIEAACVQGAVALRATIQASCP